MTKRFKKWKSGQENLKKQRKAKRAAKAVQTADGFAFEAVQSFPDEHVEGHDEAGDDPGEQELNNFIENVHRIKKLRLKYPDLGFDLGPWANLKGGKASTGLLQLGDFWGDNAVSSSDSCDTACQERSSRTSFDWRDPNGDGDHDDSHVNDAKDQGYCGSCWAFACAAALESAYSIVRGVLPEISDQQFTSCSMSDKGCQGGWLFGSFEYIKEHNMCTEDAYEYTGTDGCDEWAVNEWDWIVECAGERQCLDSKCDGDRTSRGDQRIETNKNIAIPMGQVTGYTEYSGKWINGEWIYGNTAAEMKKR